MRYGGNGTDNCLVSTAKERQYLQQWEAKRAFWQLKMEKSGTNDPEQKHLIVQCCQFYDSFKNRIMGCGPTEQ